VRDASALKAWVIRQIAEFVTATDADAKVEAPQTAEEVLSFDLIAGDASPRKYYRVALSATGASPKRSLIAVDAPHSEKNPEFLHMRQLLEQAHIRVPALIAADVEAGFLLLEDLGDDVLLPILSGHAVGAWYAMALNTLSNLAAIPVATSGLAYYDAAKLQTELNLFRDWFVPELLGLVWTEEFDEVFADFSQCLIANAVEQPQVVVHRDFHSRNLMVVRNQELAVIDFQDAVIGPITYDPVSLLKDCYVSWPRQRQIGWLLDYKGLLVREQLISAMSDDTFIAWFDLMGLQRHVKVLGIFARLCLRDGKPAYLEDLPLVLAYVIQALAIYAPSVPAIARFAEVFDQQVLPACTTQSWYRPVVLT
jgi:aminoglycoside/choline kinase family phosphotransferase